VKENDIYTALASGSPLPTSAGVRVYPVLMPQGVTMPAIRYQRVGVVPTSSLDGDSGKDLVRFQIDCFAGTYAAVKALAVEVRAALTAIGALFVSDIDGYEDDTKLYRETLDYSIWTD
jgi:hypothetical protein